MVKLIFSICFLLMLNGASVAKMNSSPLIPRIVQNGTLSITVDPAPAVGLPAPKILVIRGFVSVYQREVNWGDTWVLNIPEGNYRIHPLPVSNGSDFYLANSIFVFVPPNAPVNALVSYHLAV